MLLKLLAIMISATFLCVHMGGTNVQAESTESEADIRTNLQLLRSVDQQDQAQAMLRLRTLAQRSVDNRVSIIRALIEAMSDPRAEFDTRRACITLLGDLKATEAIDTLIKHLADLHGVTGFSEHYFPAVEALHKIGQPAIPALSGALGDPDPNTRKYAAEALILIGGKVAQERLQQALKTEQDSKVISTIESGLRYLQNSAHNQRHSENH